MSNKLKKALGAVKDQTSISLAKVVNTNSSNLQVAVLKATNRDEEPIEERYVNEILQTISSNRVHAAICANIIAKRILKIRNWVVAVKALMLVLRIFQDGDPFFPQEVLHARNRGSKILNLSTFKDDSNSNPYDYTAFARSFGFYVEERLDCFVTGKLQRRFTLRERQSSHPRSRRVNQQPVQEMKPPMLLDRICYWQRLLDRAIAMKPEGAAMTNRLVQVSLYAVVQESFDLYRDISDGLGLLLDSFFHLQHQSCLIAFQYCMKATKQFEELSSFYEFCKSLGIGRTSEYPSVQKIAEELMETLQEFLKDQASFSSAERSESSRPPQPLLLLPGPSLWEPSETADFEPRAAGSLICTSLEDLKSQTESVGAMTPSFSVDRFSETQKKECHEQEDMYNVAETGSNHSLPIDQGASVTIDFVSFDDWPKPDEKPAMLDSRNGENGSSQNVANNHSFFDNWLEQDNSQNGAKDNSYVNDWLQENQKLEQANSQDLANGNSFLDDWLQQEDKKPEVEQAPQIVVANGDSGFDDWLQEDKKQPENIKQQPNSEMDSSNCGNKEGRVLVLADASTQPSQASSQHLGNALDPSMEIVLFDQNPKPQRPYNPFLDDETDLSAAIATNSNENAAFPEDNNFSSMVPTFQTTPTSTLFPQNPNEMAAPTFQATPTLFTQNIPNEMASPTFQATQNPNGIAPPTFQATTAAFQDGQEEPFATWPTTEANQNVSSGGCMDQQNVSLQQELWLQNQNKIMARHMV